MAADGSVHVLLLTREDCGFCDDAKALLERLARDYPIETSVLDFDSEAGSRYAVEGGLMFPPGIVIEGRPLTYGRPSERRIRRELERHVRRS